MKLYFFTLLIVAVVQVSLAGPFLRYKRDNEVDSKYFIETLDEMKTAVIHMDTLVSNILKEIPERQAYANYIAAIQNYLNVIHTINYTPNYCHVKILAKFEQFTNLMSVIGDETRESGRLSDIFEQQGGNDVIEEMKAVQIKLEATEKTKFNDEENYKTHLPMSEVC